MLPTLKQPQEQPQQKSQIKKLALSKTSKSSEQSASFSVYSQKFQSQLTLNQKLKALLSSLKQKIIDTSELVNEEQDEVAKLVKERRKEETDFQHQAHTLNILISENGKLKEQVDGERNKRAIYFNVYKNLEHEIHEWQSKYKNLLIQSMKSQGAITKLKEKFRKATKKVEREMISINEELESLLKFQSSQKANQKESNTKKSNSFQQPEQSQAYLTAPQLAGEQKQPSSNPQKNRKSLDNELEYELQQKSIEVNGILNKLRQISGLTDINQIGKCYKSVEEEIEYYFGIFKEEEKREKELTDKMIACEQELNKIQQEDFDRKSTKIIGIEGENELVSYNERIKELEKSLEDKIGVKVGQLSNQMLLHHCLRVRDDRRQGKKNLEKYLEQTKKEKPEHTILLSPKEMHKKIIQGQLV